MAEGGLIPGCAHGVPGGCGADVEPAGEAQAAAGPLDDVKAALEDVVGEDGVKVGPAVAVSIDTDFATEASVVVSGTIPGS